MSKTNCINCGHGKDPDAIKCPFCGTTYLDFTSVDLESGTPCVLSLRLPGCNGVIKMKAVPTLGSITMGYDSSLVTDITFTPLAVVRENKIEMGITFHGY